MHSRSGIKSTFLDRYSLNIEDNGIILCKDMNKSFVDCMIRDYTKLPEAEDLETE